ncbi:MAG TPA: MoaD/ThiS family protein [Acidimicrobiales bacterium]|nr:MoaD/ThiS family protein [Acidimicrobiales bacterium]
MIVRIPTPLRSYTAGAAEVGAAGATVAEVVADLDRQFPGFRFRMVDEHGQLRQHVRVWVNQELVRDRSLSVAVTDADEITIMQALSGG